MTLSSKILHFLRIFVKSREQGVPNVDGGSSIRATFEEPLPAVELPPPSSEPLLELGWQKVDVSRLRINSMGRCPLKSAGISIDSMAPEHLALCRQGGCGQAGAADRIIKSASILNTWETTPVLNTFFQEMISVPPGKGPVLLWEDFEETLHIPKDTFKGYFEKRFEANHLHPVSVLMDFFDLNRHIRVSRPDMTINDGRHRICAAKKFGVDKLWIWVTK